MSFNIKNCDLRIKYYICISLKTKKERSNFNPHRHPKPRFVFYEEKDNNQTVGCVIIEKFYSASLT